MGSIPIARSILRQRQAKQGHKIGVKTLIRWESLGNRRRGGGGLMASRIPSLPQHSHVQSHAAVHKNNLCDSHAPLVARAIAGGWTRPRPCENKKLFPEILILAICVRPIRSESNHARVFPSFLCSRFNEREFSHGLDPKRSVVNVGCAAGRTTAPYRIPSRGRWMEVAADAGAICGINQCRGCGVARAAKAATN